MIKEIKKLIVKYNGATVGYLAELDGNIGFQYDEDWINNGFNISPFSLPLERRIFINKKILSAGYTVCLQILFRTAGENCSFVVCFLKGV